VDVVVDVVMVGTSFLDLGVVIALTAGGRWM
jgi:hypothetical protein